MAQLITTADSPRLSVQYRLDRSPQLAARRPRRKETTADCVGVIVNGSTLDIDLLCFENYGSTSGDDLADPTRSVSSPIAIRDVSFHSFSLKKALNYEGEVL